MANPDFRLYIVIFNINEGVNISTYTKFFNALESSGLYHQKLSHSTYAVKWPGGKTASDLISHLSPYLKDRDTLIVINSTTAHAEHGNPSAYKFINDALPSQLDQQ